MCTACTLDKMEVESVLIGPIMKATLMMSFYLGSQVDKPSFAQKKSIATGPGVNKRRRLNWSCNDISCCGCTI